MSQVAENEESQSNSLLPAGTAEQEITLILPRDYLGPTVAGKWRRLEDGRIIARFARWELEFVLQFYRDVVQPVLTSNRGHGAVTASKGEARHD